MAFLTTADLESFAEIDETKAEQMIADAVALAVLNAPCLADEDSLTPLQIAATKAVLRSAVLRWNESGTGALQAQTAGPFSQTLDNRLPRRGMFWPSEIEQLQAICKGTEPGGAFSIDTTGGRSVVHADTCDLYFGGAYCSCGAVLTMNLPLYGRSWC